MNQTAGLLVLLTAALGSAPALAVPEQPAFQEVYDQQILPYFDSSGVPGDFIGVDGVPIAYRVFTAPAEKGAIVLVNGKGEFMRRYAELVYDLRNEGYSIYLLDNRGQGESGRILNDVEKVFVRNFEDYVTDLSTFVDTVVRARAHPRLYLLGHSMGGAISSWYLEAHPGVFDAAVLSAPMLEINTGPIPEDAAYAMASAASWLGHGPDYAIGQGPYDPNASSSKPLTLRMAESSRVMRLYYPTYPAQGGATYRWLKTSFDADARILDEATEVTTPVLLMQAGKDTLVRPGGQNRFCEYAHHCTKVIFPDSSHNILLEHDPIRSDAIARIVEFFR